MRPRDVFGIGWSALRAHRLRTRMTAGAIAIGVASVIALTSLGEGARDWVVERFSALGSNVLIVIPGRTETRGGPPLTPSTTRDLTLEDMLAIPRRMPGIQRVVPFTIAEATAKYAERGRKCPIVGSTREFLSLRGVGVSLGTSLPPIDPRRGTRVCVIGRKVQSALFGERNPLGEKIRVGEWQFRVVGTIMPKGQSIGVDLDEIVLIPVATAMQMFNKSGLFRIMVQVTSFADLDTAKERLHAILKERHEGEDDLTLMTPGAVAQSLTSIIDLITMALAAIAGISLGVAGIGVMNVMIVSVTERRAEIGLMKAVGAANPQVLAIFLGESVALSLFGGGLGVVAGVILTRLARFLYPSIPFESPLWAIQAGFGVAAAVGIAFGILPALRAARLPPLEGLRRGL